MLPHWNQVKQLFKHEITENTTVLGAYIRRIRVISVISVIRHGAAAIFE